jgi:hypothetical protein
VASKAAARQREAVVGSVADRLGRNEPVVAVLPFAATPARPRTGGKVREGIYQTNRRYRPLVATDRRLFVLDAARTPYPRGVLAEFPIGSVAFVDVTPRSFGQQRVRLELPGNGVVPFDVGRLELDDLARLRELLGADAG